MLFLQSTGCSVPAAVVGLIIFLQLFCSFVSFFQCHQIVLGLEVYIRVWRFLFTFASGSLCDGTTAVLTVINPSHLFLICFSSRLFQTITGDHSIYSVGPMVDTKTYIYIYIYIKILLRGA